MDDDIYMPAPDSAGKPRIRILPGETYRISALVERELWRDGVFYHAGGPIIRVVHSADGDVKTELVNEHTLSLILASKIDWEKLHNGSWGRCDPPANVVQSLLRRQDRPYLRPLAGLARQPFFTPSRKLITTSGYNAETGIYGAFDSADYDLADLTRAKAEAACGRLLSLLREFEFGSLNDLAASLSAFLTAAVRPSLELAPAYSLTATQFGSGKSYLAKMISLIASPGEPYNVSFPGSAEEATKVLLAVLMAKPAVVLFDDMQTDWKSYGPLNKVLTSSTITERLLGVSLTATARTNVLILGTGNNIEPVRDMRRRVVSIRIAPSGEGPAALRRFEGSPLDDVRTNRAAIVGAALTIVGAYLAEGAPAQDAAPIGTYEEWSTLCRQPVMWLGLPDPATSLIEQLTNDPDLEQLTRFLAAWYSLFRSSPVPVRDLLKEAGRDADLGEALEDLPITDRGDVNPNKLGWFLKKNSGRWAGNFRVEQVEAGDRTRWRVVYRGG